MKTPKEKMIDKIGSRYGEKKKTVLAIVDRFMEAVKEHVKTEGHLTLRGFGTFYAVTRKPKKSNLPSAGMKVYPAKRIVKFEPSKNFELEQV